MKNCAEILSVRICSPGLRAKACGGRVTVNYMQGAQCLVSHQGSRMVPILPKLLVHREGATSALRIQFTPW